MNIALRDLTIVHWELLLRALLVALFAIYLILKILDSLRGVIQKKQANIKQKKKDQKKLEKQQHHQGLDTSIDPLDRFAGLVKPEERAVQDISEEQQEEIFVETITIDATPTSEATTSSKDAKDHADPTIQQEITYQHQDKLDKLRAEALRAKEKGQIDLYEKKLVEWLALEPQYPSFLWLLADHYFHTGKNKKALTLLKRLLDQDKTNHRAMRQMGEIYLTHGDMKTAEIMIEQAVKHQNSNPKYLYSLVDIKYNTDKLEDAIYLMDKILKLRPTNIEYLIATAMLYEKKGDADRARRYYATILEYSPENSIAKAKIKEL
jgi:tetratricopeptide (TPR) repeat protein